MGEMKETHCWERCNSATPIKHLLCLLTKLNLSVEVLILRKKVGTLIWSQTTFHWLAGQDISRTFPCAAITKCDVWKIKGFLFKQKGIQIQYAALHHCTVCILNAFHCHPQHKSIQHNRTELTFDIDGK